MSKPKNSASAPHKPAPVGSEKAAPPTTPPPPTDDFEPSAIRASAPVWLFVLLMVLIYWSMIHLDDYAGGFNDRVYGPYHSYQELADLQPKSGPEQEIARGAAIFATTCQPCHQATGMGTPGQFPPLVGSEWVLGSPDRLARIPNNGLQGPITVKGQTWSLAMPAIGGTLSDEDLAAVLSYVRNAWGNSAPVVTPAQVKHVRDEIGSRSREGTAPWNSDELMKVQ
jgi:mono/diheme cytochrome c family protein